MTTMRPTWATTVENAMVRVGEGGRGFIVRVDDDQSYVVTAAHCLPVIPEPHPGRYTEEATYGNLVCALSGADDSRVTVEAVFVDVIADLAVLGEPDSQALSDEHDRFLDFMGSRPAVEVGSPTGVRPSPLGRPTSPGWLLGGAGQTWHQAQVTRYRKTLSLVASDQTAYAPGTSGSPILDANGNAIGVVSTGDHLNPMLSRALPMWLAELLVRPSAGDSGGRESDGG
jgi:S1-C subfamily serine protease